MISAPTEGLALPKGLFGFGTLEWSSSGRRMVRIVITRLWGTNFIYFPLYKIIPAYKFDLQSTNVFYLTQSTWRKPSTSDQFSWEMPLQQHLITINGEYIEIDALLFHWYVAVETWMRGDFSSRFDKIAKLSWSKRALSSISRLVLGLNRLLKALCV